MNRPELPSRFPADIPLTKAETHRTVAAVFRRHRRVHRQGRTRLYRHGSIPQHPGPLGSLETQSPNRRDDRHPRLAGARFLNPARPCAMPSTRSGSELVPVHPPPALVGGSSTAGPQCQPTGPVPPPTRAGARRLNRPRLRFSRRPDRDCWRQSTSASSAGLMRDSCRPMTFIAETS